MEGAINKKKAVLRVVKNTEKNHTNKLYLGQFIIAFHKICI